MITPKIGQDIATKIASSEGIAKGLAQKSKKPPFRKFGSNCRRIAFRSKYGGCCLLHHRFTWSFFKSPNVSMACYGFVWRCKTWMISTNTVAKALVMRLNADHAWKILVCHLVTTMLTIRKPRRQYFIIQDFESSCGLRPSSLTNSPSVAFDLN